MLLKLLVLICFWELLGKFWKISKNFGRPNPGIFDRCTFVHQCDFKKGLKTKEFYSRPRFGVTFSLLELGFTRAWEGVEDERILLQA